MNYKDLFKNIDITNDKYIVIGVSAGPDSMALLHMVQKYLSINIVCAHINHNKRKESDAEENYLKEYCKKNNIIFETMKIDKYIENNFENEARNKRYNFYEKILKKYNSHNLFLAHHGDDLIETVLMKIMRGTNLEGYAGIKKISNLDNYKIIRPLLELTKDDILEYNKKNNLKYYIDKSNKDQNYTRNRYRSKIIPFLKTENKNAHKQFLKFAETIVETYNFIEDITKEKLKEIIKENKIDIKKLNNENNYLKKNIIFYYLSEIYNNKSDIIKEKHINDIIKLSINEKPNQIINLPQNLIAIKRYNYITVEKNVKQLDNYKIKFDKNVLIDDIQIKLIDKINSDGNDVCRLNSKNIKLPLYLRNRKDGDTIEVKGLNGHKKIKEIFIESKIPKDKRNNYPLLVDNNDTIIWIPFIKKSKYVVKNNEMYDIILNSHKEREEKNENKK